MITARSSFHCAARGVPVNVAAAAINVRADVLTLNW